MAEEVTSRCKVYIETITLGQGEVQTLHIRGIEAKGVPENQSFNRFSPNITGSIMIDNPALKGKFRPGQRFYLDWIEAPDSPKE